MKTFFFYYCDLWSGWLKFLFQAEDEKHRAQQVSSCYNIQAVEGFSVMWHGQTASRQCNEFFKPFFSPENQSAMTDYCDEPVPYKVRFVPLEWSSVKETYILVSSCRNYGKYYMLLPELICFTIVVELCFRGKRLSFRMLYFLKNWWCFWFNKCPDVSSAHLN